MKKQIFLLVLLCISTFLSAQEFMGKGVFVKGLHIERELSWKGKPQNIQKEDVVYVTKDKKGRDMSQIGSLKYNKAGTKPYGYGIGQTVNTMCDGTNYEFDLYELSELEGILPLLVFGSYNFKYDGEPILLPVKYTEGEKLPDVHRTVLYRLDQGPDYPYKVYYTLTNRKVEGKETITTPAGTFECIKYSWLFGESDRNEAIVGVNTSTYWISDGLIVKTEQKSPSGKLLSSSQIIQAIKK
jgi:hypothetical protein